MNRTLFRGATLINGIGNQVIEKSEILIEGEFIRQIGKINDMDVDSDTNIVDLFGKTIMPGMIDAHTHILFEPFGDVMKSLKEHTHTEIIISAIRNLEALK